MSIAPRARLISI